MAFSDLERVRPVEHWHVYTGRVTGQKKRGIFAIFGISTKLFSASKQF